ncbi:MAG TPA: CBS domain-containing protein [Sphingomicrobium sp.]|jgi:CBS domain-containing protein|nr:CBS domain-containing protein [Sphingomicrobium sp.]
MTMKISEVMTTEVETIGADQTAREAASFMLRADAGSIPVCDDGKVIGMITDRDIAVRGVAEGRGPDTPVSELMSDGIICAREDEDIQEVARRMSEEQVRRLPVLDAEDRLCGIVSLGDLTRETRGEAAQTALEGVSSPGGSHQQ